MIVDAAPPRSRARRTMAEVARKNRHPHSRRQEQVSRGAQAGARVPAPVANGFLDRRLSGRRRFHAALLRAQQWAEQQCLLPDEGVGPHLRKDAGDGGVTRARPALSKAVADGGSERRNEASRYPSPE